MRIDVFCTPAEAPQPELAGRIVAVIDVLRASTTIAVALANGARAIIPFESGEEAVTRSKAFEKSHVRLAGERKMLPIPGFDLGNSPTEFTSAAVDGRTILLSTTNGTAAFGILQGVRDATVASYVNFSAVLAMLRAAVRGGTDVSLICAGSERQFALEDAACAGRFVRHLAQRLKGVELNDGAHACVLIERRYGDNIARLFGDTEHGRALAAAGFAEDLITCAGLDTYPVVPIYQDRQIVKLGTDSGR